MIPFVIFKVAPQNENMTHSHLLNSSRILVSEACGANDCQLPSQEDPSKYRQAEQTTIYIMLGVFLVMTFVGAISYMFIPSPANEDLSLWRNEIQGADNEGFSSPEPHHADKGKERLDENGNVCKVEVETPVAQSTETFNVVQCECQTETADKSKSIKNELLGILHQLVNRKQLLMSPMQFQYGFHMSFVFAEVTRAYVSCVFGVTEVGLSTAIYGASSLLMSLFAGKMFGRLGRLVQKI
uniref:uncharacterized protein LOC100180611 n=1 Tax=Ciona intestinalis TaxID=7719 RepID=UPI000EF4D1FE|nr:uncharacterized protein LOC100180611 [Ciona intestinalis]|eukprot:XP_026691957.1 uncharacterized protein LOC100180611 [Ciona intestinalis]